jgi:hypothetical protein
VVYQLDVQYSSPVKNECFGVPQIDPIDLICHKECKPGKSKLTMLVVLAVAAVLVLYLGSVAFEEKWRVGPVALRCINRDKIVDYLQFRAAVIPLVTAMIFHWVVDLTIPIFAMGRYVNTFVWA